MAKLAFDPPLDYVDSNRKKFDREYNSLSAGGYHVGTFEYPEGLRVKPDLQHYVVFLINAREKSQLGKQALDEGKAFRVPENNISRLEQQAIEGSGKVVADNAFALGALAGFLGTSGKGVATRATAALAAGATTAVGTEILKNIDVFKSGRTVRLRDVITLHLEERPSVKYGVNYTEKEFGFLTGLLVQGSAAKTLGQDFVNEAAARIVSQLITLPSLDPGRGGTLSNLRELGTREKTNPFREVLFESVDYRTFQFRYKFFPKSINETNKIRDIIEVFKKHMHPELSANKFFYVYPSEFEIKYYYRDKENDYLHKFATCALTDMQIDYGGDQFATFENGAPVEIGVTLTFKELEQLTSKAASDGY